MGNLEYIDNNYYCDCKKLVLQNFDERELEWEHREVELERIIAMLEGQQLEIAGAANQVTVYNLIHLTSAHCKLFY